MRRAFRIVDFFFMSDFPCSVKADKVLLMSETKTLEVFFLFLVKIDLQLHFNRKKKNAFNDSFGASGSVYVILSCALTCVFWCSGNLLISEKDLIYFWIKKNCLECAVGGAFDVCLC